MPVSIFQVGTARNWVPLSAQPQIVAFWSAWALGAARSSRSKGGRHEVANHSPTAQKSRSGTAGLSPAAPSNLHRGVCQLAHPLHLVVSR